MLLRRRPYPFLFLVAASFILTACSASAPPPRIVQSAPEMPPVPPNGVPSSALGRGIYKVGHPYQVDGTWYYPAENQAYDETGIASWYGPNFHKNYTANGEIFDQNTMSGAHRTLPLPSIVQVTNLENGRMIEVRVNDRGPFVGDRIIDLSRRSAQLLGFERQGTAKVRVQYVLAESLTAQSIARTNNVEGIASAPAAVPTAVVTAQLLPPAGAGATYNPPPEPAYQRPRPPVADHGYISQTLAPPQTAYAPPPYRGTPRSPPQRAAPAQPDHVLTPPHAGAPGPALPQRVTVVPVGPTHIYIQAGAFGVSDNAARMRQRLAALGPVNVTTVRVKGLTIYRVRLGPIASVDDADRMRLQAIQAGATQARIVVN